MWRVLLSVCDNKHEHTMSSRGYLCVNCGLDIDSNECCCNDMVECYDEEKVADAVETDIEFATTSNFVLPMPCKPVRQDALSLQVFEELDEKDGYSCPYVYPYNEPSLEKEWLCRICGQTFRKKENLKSHWNKIKNFTCNDDCVYDD